MWYLPFRACTLIAAINSELLIVRKQALEDLMLEFPAVRPTFEGTRDLVAAGKLDVAGFSCRICGGHGPAGGPGRWMWGRSP